MSRMALAFDTARRRADQRTSGRIGSVGSVGQHFDHITDYSDIAPHRAEGVHKKIET